MWVGNCGNHSGTGRVVPPGLVAFSPAQQAAGGVVAIPAISITSSGVFKCPHGVVFDGSGNGWIADEDGRVYIYYASSDTRMHVATTTIEQLLDYVVNTPEDEGTSAGSVTTLQRLIDKNKAWL